MRRWPSSLGTTPRPDAAGERIGALAGKLRHYDPSQLYFQIAEIAGEQTYLRHGVEVRDGDIVLDVGANVGVAAAFFATHCGARVVHSFEPVPPIFELLRENLKDLPACVPHPWGLSSAAGAVPITYYPGAAAMSGLYADPERDRELVRTALLNFGLSELEADERLEGRYDRQVMTCELRTLSSFLREERLTQVDLLKVDVERAELDVLGGIDEGDWPKIKQVAIEAHDDDGRCAAIAGTLEELGYRVTTDQDSAMRGTFVRMLYATRP
jgi:31-O-methyltransferase